MDSILPLLKQTKDAGRSLRALPNNARTAILLELAQQLREAQIDILSANQLDLAKMDDSDPKKDRLLLNEARVEALAASVESIANLKDPTQVILTDKVLANGLHLIKKSVPLGVVGVIYESRPNVTIDVAALCIKSANACVLRGGSDAYHTNLILVQVIQKALEAHSIPAQVVQLLPVDRSQVSVLLNAVDYIDILIPRGSQSLIEFVRSNSKVPVIETGAGVCHTYIEATADLDQAAAIVMNAKVSRPSVCNALDTLLIDQKVAAPLLGKIVSVMAQHEVTFYADPASYIICQQLDYPYLQQAQPADFGREFLDYKCSIKVVADIEEALAHIETYSSKHSEAIVTQQENLAERFMQEVDAAAVYVNASTRFTDGGEFGLGAEIGISTQKLHARGPFALEKLVTEKWFIYGNGQVR